jgi:hypothetical protein
MLDVIDLFRERDTRDELGIGTIRDAFADLFFPSTTTIQTRARYFFFVSWMYRELEGRRTQSALIADRARKYEIALIEALLASGNTDGVLGSVSGKTLQRLPSNIYWQGLGILGIRIFPGSQEQYHRSLDRFYLRKGRQSRDDDGELVGDVLQDNWHSGIPQQPDDFPRIASLDLTRSEARYLQERITTQEPDSLLRYLSEHGRPVEDLEFPWFHPQFGEFPIRCQEQLRHARNFSEVMHGASLLYNLMLAEMRKNEELVSNYENRIQDWKKIVRERHADLAAWDRQRLLQIVRARGARISRGTQLFVENWLELAKQGVDGEATRELVHDRERALKRSMARLDNHRALELWSGAAGTAQLNFRWRIAQRILKDIHKGLSREDSNA